MYCCDLIYELFLYKTKSICRLLKQCGPRKLWEILPCLAHVLTNIRKTPFKICLIKPIINLWSSALIKQVLWNIKSRLVHSRLRRETRDISNIETWSVIMCRQRGQTRARAWHVWVTFLFNSVYVCAAFTYKLTHFMVKTCNRTQEAEFSRS